MKENTREMGQDARQEDIKTMPRKKKQSDYDQLVASIKQENLDNRTSVARAMKETRKALADNPTESMKAIIRNNIAFLTMLQTEIVKETQNKPVMVDGRLEKRFTDDLLSIQKVMIQNCTLLSLMEERDKGKKEPRKKVKTNGNIEVANAILECHNN